MFASIVLERGRCAWGKCYFCGWGKVERKTSVEELKKKFLEFLERNEGIYGIKIFSSGSFLDENQFPRNFVKWCIEKAKEFGIKEIIFESRPEFIREDALKEIKVEGIKITVAIGLEAADDRILEIYNKGFKVKDYLEAVKTLRENGFGVRTYLLVNGHPILWKNRELQKNVLRKSVKLCLEKSDSIVVINAYPHKNSKLFEDWCNGIWRPLDFEEFFNLVGEVLSEFKLTAFYKGEEIFEVSPKNFVFSYEDGKIKFAKSVEELEDVKEAKIELDFNNFNFIPRFRKREFIKGAKIENILHPHFEIWQDYIARFYRPPKEKEYALFLPCTYKKPYCKSKTMREIMKHISGFPFFKKIHLIVVSNPGVVPQEFWDKYPFNSYDWPEWEETRSLMRIYKIITKRRVKKYVSRKKKYYKHFFAFFHLHSETLEAIREAFKELGLEEKLTIVLDEETYRKIVREVGKKSASIVRHPLAIKRLKEVLKASIS